jgi:hypothetical protein
MRTEANETYSIFFPNRLVPINDLNDIASFTVPKIEYNPKRYLLKCGAMTIDPLRIIGINA